MASGARFNGDNGWAITPHGPQCDSVYRDREKAGIAHILEKQVIRLLRTATDGWVRK
jgi:starch phosphorylase